MYGGDETSTPSPSIYSQPQREVNVDENISSKKKAKAPIPTIITTKPTDPPVSTDRSRSFSAINEITSSSDILFGLSTIKENLDTDENIANTNNEKEEEIDFNSYFNRKEQKTTTKKPAPTIPRPKEQKRSTPSQSYDIQTPSASISISTKTEPSSTSTKTKQSDDNTEDSTDEDVDELLGKLEVSVLGKYTHTYIHTHILFPIFFIL